MPAGFEDSRRSIELFINHDAVSVSGPDIFLPLSTFLRRQQGLIGTKVVCEEGDCGACTVLLGWPGSGELSYQTVDACIQFVFQLDQCHVITVEGLSKNGQLHRAQEALIDCFGSQCGFCTPGFAVAMADLARDQAEITVERARQKLTGNLCRCTGYEPILDACRELDRDRGADLLENFDTLAIRTGLEAHAGRDVLIECETYSGPKAFFRPATLPAALKWKREFPETRIVAGATDVGVQINKGRTDPERIMFVAHLGGLGEIEEREDDVVVGAAANWAIIERKLAVIFPQLAEILGVFASEQIKNAATIGGNIANASPIADSLPFLYVMESTLLLTRLEDERRLPINEFYRGYKQLDLAPDEIIRAIEIPRPGSGDLLRLYKVSRRRDLDISSFTAAIRLKLDENEPDLIRRARIACGGVGPMVLRMPETEEFLNGKTLSESTMAAAGEIAAREVTPISDVRGEAEYRRRLARNVFLKFYFETTGQAEADTVAGGAA